MASHSISVRRPVAFRGVGRSILLTLPIALWALLMFTPAFQNAGSDFKIAAALTIVFMTTLFFLMMRTGETYRWRRIFFVALGFLFPVGFYRGLDRRARHNEHSCQPDGLGRHAVLLHGDAIAHFAGGVCADDYFSGIDSAYGEQSAIDRGDDRRVVRHDAGAGQGVVQLRLLFWRH